MRQRHQRGFGEDRKENIRKRQERKKERGERDSHTPEYLNIKLLFFFVMAGRERGWGGIYATESRTRLEQQPTKADNYTRLLESVLMVTGYLFQTPSVNVVRPLGLKLVSPHMQVGSQAKGRSSCQPAENRGIKMKQSKCNCKRQMGDLGLMLSLINTQYPSPI